MTGGSPTALVGLASDRTSSFSYGVVQCTSALLFIELSHLLEDLSGSGRTKVGSMHDVLLQVHKVLRHAVACRDFTRVTRACTECHKGDLVPGSAAMV